MEVADADRGVDSRAPDGGHDRAREVALLEDADARPGRGDVGDELLVTWTLEDRHGEVLDAEVVGEGDPSQVVRHRVVQVDGAARARAGDELLHLGDGRQRGEAAWLDRDQQRDSVDVPPGDLAGALHRVDAKVDLSVSASDDARGLERLAHRLARGVADRVRVALAEQARARQRRRLGRVEKPESELALLPVYGEVGFSSPFMGRCRRSRRRGRPRGAEAGNPAPLLLHGVSRRARSLAAPRDEAPSGRRSAGTPP